MTVEQPVLTTPGSHLVLLHAHLGDDDPLAEVDGGEGVLAARPRMPDSVGYNVLIPGVLTETNHHHLSQQVETPDLVIKIKHRLGLLSLLSWVTSQ